MSTMTPAQLTAWIDDLRGRLERDELATIGGPIPAGKMEQLTFPDRSYNLVV